jgi:hypothetical protein
MLIYVNTRTSRSETGKPVSVLPCLHSFDARLQAGVAIALVRRFSR